MWTFPRHGCLGLGDFGVMTGLDTLLAFVGLDVSNDSPRTKSRVLWRWVLAIVS